MAGITKWLPAWIGADRELEPDDREDLGHPDDPHVLQDLVFEAREGGL